LGIVTDYPVWFILFCLIAGGIYSFSLYFRTRNNEIVQWLVWVMAVFRFLTVSILAFLLLSPLLKKNSEIIEKPLILFVQDNSQSIPMGRDSGYYKKDYPVVVDQLISRLNKKFEVVTYSFGEKLRTPFKTTYSEKSTDISAIFTDFTSRYANRNIGAMILATDGIYNKGSNPYYASKKLSFPVYTVALGDTLILKDIILKKVVFNRTAFLGDKFPIEIQVKADKCKTENTEISVIRNDQVLSTKKLSFFDDNVFQKVSFILDAKDKGIQHYTVRISPLNGEINKANNRAEIFVDIRDTREKVALLYQAPHPDITALRQAIESPMKYDLTVSKLSEFTDKPEKFDLIILYQVPSITEINNLTSYMSAGTSLLFILGSQSDIGTFNGLKTGLQILSSKETSLEAIAAFNPNFSLFTTDKELLGSMNYYPPLLSPFGTYKYSPASEILFYQKIGNVVSSQPLILFIQNPAKKIGIIAGENLWKWRLTDYSQRGNHDAFNEWIIKMVQYLSVREDRSLFRVRCNDRFQENENVEFECELYNESYEMINQPDVNLVIKDEEGKSYNYLFGKSEKSYYLDAGIFPVGKYTYSASVKVGNSILRKEGTFIIDQVNLETINLVADHSLLFMISMDHGGEMVYPSKLGGLADKITLREDIRPVIYWKKRFADLIGNPWIFGLILLLLTAEWFLRKRNGIY
jgi:hypothetical protein